MFQVDWQTSTCRRKLQLHAEDDARAMYARLEAGPDTKWVALTIDAPRAPLGYRLVVSRGGRAPHAMPDRVRA